MTEAGAGRTAKTTRDQTTEQTTDQATEQTTGRTGPAGDGESRERARRLERALRDAVRGEVEFDATQRALMTMDASNYRRVPSGVVVPRDAEDVAAALGVCREHGVPVVPRGGGTSIAGQATGTGVVLDFTRGMNEIVSLDPETRTAVVQPGVICDQLRDAAAPHGLTFGPDPSTHSRCTLGGMIGNNSCGSHSVAWGTTADNVEALRALTYGGELLRLGRGDDGVPEPLRSAVRGLVDENLALLRTGFPELPRRISGYALDALLPERGQDWARAFAGSEGTLGVLTEATVRLVESPAVRALVVLGYPDESAAADAASALVAERTAELAPLTVEGMAADLVPPAGRQLLPRGDAWLFVEVGGATPAEARAGAEAVSRAAGDGPTDRTVVVEPAGQRALWRIREDASGTATRMPGGAEAWPGWEDCAVPPARLGAYLRDFRGLLAEHGLRGLPYGHFGDGCIHVRIDFDLLSEAGVRRFRDFSGELAELVVAHGGSLSGEHGDGQARAEFLPTMYGEPLVALFGQFKDVWDPTGGLNPGILVRPHRIDENLRFAVLPKRPVDVAFGYPHDGGDFSAAVRRCVGVAKCRETAPSGTSVMCPSFRATRDERHSTRGRARLLHEMLAGDVVTDGWQSTEVHEALDLCLSCKGCRSDCPVGVDMATYKAEFLHQRYQGRRRPAAHYAMGRLPTWLRAGAALRVAPLVNAASRVPLLAWLVKRLGGITPERTLPRLAREPFTRWWRRRPSPEHTGSPESGPHGFTGTPVSEPEGAPVSKATRTQRGTSEVRGASTPDPSARRRAERKQDERQTVVLWPDTFTNYLSPEVGRSAVAVLEDAGLRVVLPPGPVCCGLTWVSTGQLDQARTVMRRTLDTVEAALDAGLPVVGLEPSCAAALRTDLPELLSDDPRARRLADAVRTFAQTLEEYAPQWQPPTLNRPAAGQTHCHQHAVLGDAAELRLRERAGLTGTLSGGCCGLAGNFGFERGHYEVSTACAEEQLLPSVRTAEPGTELLADGFSCRTQLADLGGVRARHLAEVLAEGMTGEESGRTG